MLQLSNSGRRNTKRKLPAEMNLVLKWKVISEGGDEV